MSAPDQTGLQQRAGYSNQEYTGASYPNQDYTGASYPNQDYTGAKGVGGPQGYPQGYSVPQSYGPQPAYQGPQHGPDEYVDKHGRIVRKRRGGAFACCLALCWCITWPCHAPCCCGL